MGEERRSDSTLISGMEHLKAGALQKYKERNMEECFSRAISLIDYLLYPNDYTKEACTAGIPIKVADLMPEVLKLGYPEPVVC